MKHEVMMKRGMLSLALAFALSTGAAAQQATRAGHGSPYDQEIQSKITQELGKKDKFKNVQAKADDQFVTLSGTVQKYADKEDADRRAHNIEHVQGVRNQIQVAGPTVSDAELQEKLSKKLRYDRIGYGIVYNALSLGVKNGVVTITGKVRTDPDKASALAIVENQPGVKGVIEDIDVLPTSFHDDDIRVATANAIYSDATLSRYAMDPQAPIRIVVENGHVTLYGTVDNETDKNIAGMRANGVTGVFSVSNKLQVASGEKVK
jgi:hyperosmotically inducible periplasmic protein